MTASPRALVEKPMPESVASPDVAPLSSKSSNQTVTMTFHIDPELKREVTEIVKDFGLNLTSVTRAFYKQIVRDGGIPLSLRYEVKGVQDPDVIIGQAGLSQGNAALPTAGDGLLISDREQEQAIGS